MTARRTTLVVLALLTAGAAAWGQKPQVQPPPPPFPPPESTDPPPSRRGDKRGEEDLKKIQGTWVLVESTTKEHVLEKVREDSAEQFWRTFEGNTVTDWNKDKIRSGTFRLDPSVEPRKIDINWDDGNEYGIYKLEDDRLTICTARGDAKDRPNNFNPRALKGDDQALRVFKRSDKQKEEAPRPSPGRTEPDVVPPPLKGQPRKKPEREGPADDRLPPGKTPPRRSPGADRRLPPS